MALGIGAMISGGSEDAHKQYYGQKVMSAEMVGDELRLGLSGGKTIHIWDNGQSCCGHRYMTTDDDVKSLVGGNLIRIEAKDAPDGEGGEVHECVFVEIATDKGFITLVNHNEHNGYYGGFGLTISES